jgi:hypothetical protein
MKILVIGGTGTVGSQNAMTKEDLGAIYQFVRYLGPSGKPEPAYLPPDQEPKGPHALFPAPPK